MPDVVSHGALCSTLTGLCAVYRLAIVARTPLPTERTLLQGVAVARWAAWAWLAVTTLLQRHSLDHPLVAALLVGAAFAWTANCTRLLRTHTIALLHPLVVSGELALAWVLLVADGWVFESGHAFEKGQNLAGNWPFIATLSAATAIGPWWGGVSGALVGTGRFFGGLVNGVQNWPGERVTSLGTTMVFYAVGGTMWGLVTLRLRQAEGEVAMRRARDEVARTLHDGVLQTLALVERRTRTADPELSAVARTSDRELRAWLFHGGTESSPTTSLESMLREAGSHVSVAYDLPVTVSVVDDREPRQVDARLDAAIAAAAREALTNAAKHAEATRVTVYAETEDDATVFVSVRDDGHGFDVRGVSAGRGIEHSIRRRMEEIGGRVEIVSTPTTGTEVRLWSR